MIPVLAHGGAAGLAVELGVLSLPLLGFALLWWWNRRLHQEQAAETEPGTADEPDREVEP